MQKSLFINGFRNFRAAQSFPMVDGEKQLIRQAIRGTSSAFGSLYDHYQPMIYRFVLLKVSHREEAEDLTHQVFLSAWQNIGTYADTGNPFSSWLYQIARNKVIDYYRTRRPAADLEEADAAYFSTDAETVEADIDASFRIEEVMGAIRLLKPQYQDVLIMRFIEDCSIKETAAALAKTESAIKVLQHRALHALRLSLAEGRTTLA